MRSTGTLRVARERRPAPGSTRRPPEIRRRPGATLLVAPSATSILTLQRAAGNTAVARAVAATVVQRRPAQTLIDKHISLKAARPQVVDDELVPIGEAPGRFEGFGAKADAVSLAQRSPEVSVVVRDPDKYHVLRTTATTLGGKAAAPEDPKGWVIVEVVEPTKVSASDAFERDRVAAQSASGDVQALAYRRLLVSGTHLDLAETAWSGSEKDQTAGKVHVALWLPSRGRHEPAEVVPTGTATLPATTILIGKTPFTEGAVSLRSTLLHEARHAYHMAQTLELVRRWRSARKSDTLTAWQEWLKTQRKRVPPEVFQTTWAATDPGYGTATTETYSHLYGFMYQFRRDDDAAKAPADLGADATSALHLRLLGLHVLGENWEAAGQDAKEATMDRLVGFATGLTANHREHLKAFMTANAKGRGTAPRLFYREFAQRI